MNPPKFLHDLHADLRDRKLLPLVVVLVLAMVAVPVLLKSDTEAPAPIDAAAAATDVPEGIPSPAVLVSEPGLRDYHERLEALRESNPFASKAVEADLSESAIQDVSGGTGTNAAVGSGGGTTSSFSEAVTESTTTQTDIAVDESTSETTETTNTSDGPDDDSGRWFTFSVDVLTGPAGDTRRRNNLQGLTVLPSRSNPVAVYIGIDDGGKEAVFMVSPDVVDNRGDGSCLPSAADCQFLSLRKGDEQKLEYAPSGDADTYVLEVKDITFEELKDPRDSDSTADGKKARAGLEAFAGD